MDTDEIVVGMIVDVITVGLIIICPGYIENIVKTVHMARNSTYVVIAPISGHSSYLSSGICMIEIKAKTRGAHRKLYCAVGASCGKTREN